MMSCRRASERISQELDDELSWHQAAVLHVHRWMCGNCRRFSAQLHILHEAMNDHAPLPPDATTALIPLPLESRTRLQESLTHALSGTGSRED